MPDEFYAGETVVLTAYLEDSKGRRQTPQPDAGVTVKVVAINDDDTDGTEILAEAAATRQQEDGGQATSGTGSTLTETGRTWVPDQYRGMLLRLTGGMGADQERRILSNTADTITIDPNEPGVLGAIPGPLFPAPDSTTLYQVHAAFYTRKWDSPTNLAGSRVRSIVKSDDTEYVNIEKHDIKLE